MDAIVARNLEALTYHFIVRARPSGLPLAELRSENDLFEDRNVASFQPNYDSSVAAQTRRLAFRSRIEIAVAKVNTGGISRFLSALSSRSNKKNRDA